MTPSDVAASVALLGHAEGITEVRALPMGGKGSVLVGYFDDLAALQAEVARIDGNGRNVYVGVQPRPGELLGRSRNRLGRCEGGRRGDIETLTSLVLDIDPDRPKDTASTDAELDLAVGRAGLVCDWFVECGWLRPVRAMSGNGVQVWAALPPTTIEPEHRAELQARLKAFEATVRERFSGDGVSIDSTHDLARITKLIGTMSVKGEDTPDRPHRLTRFMDGPARREDAALLQHILSMDVVVARPAPAPVRTTERTTPWGRVRLEELIREVLEAPVSPGGGVQGRNATLNRAAFKVGGGVASGNIDEAEALAALEQVAHDVGLDEREIRAILPRAIHDGMAHPTGPEPRVPRPARTTTVEDLDDVPPPSDEDAPLQEHEQQIEHKAADADIKPRIVVYSGFAWKAVNAAVETLTKTRGVFQRDGSLVWVRGYQREDHASGKVQRSEGSPIIAALERPSLWEILSKNADWWRPVKGAPKPGEGPKLARCNPPSDVVSAVHARGYWPGVNYLDGLVTAPLLRLDGSVSTRPGYDEQTRSFYMPHGVTPVIAIEPNQVDARKSRETILDVVSEFPFADDMSRDGWMAALLTPLVRHLTPCVPAFVLDASTPGTGKTLLSEVIGWVVTGRTMPRGPSPTNEDEARKRWLSHALMGDTCILIDNVPSGGAFGWPSLDAVLTAPMVEDRVLGESRIARAVNRLTVYATGNNLSIRGDTARRALRIRITPDCERPEDRTGFVHTDLVGWVKSERSRLLGAALTILSAYLRAGCPDVGVRPLGSFEEWSRIVRGAVVWAGGVDPLALLANREEGNDPDVEAHVSLLVAWGRYPGGLTAAEAIEYATTRDPQDADLRAALESICTGKQGVTPKSLGHRLRALKGRVRHIDGLGAVSIDMKTKKKQEGRRNQPTRWVVSGTSGTSGTLFSVPTRDTRA